MTRIGHDDQICGLRSLCTATNTLGRHDDPALVYGTWRKCPKTLPSSVFGRAPFTDVPSPEQVLAGRFARGEIDETQYRERVAVLRDHIRQ